MLMCTIKEASILGEDSYKLVGPLIILLPTASFE